MTFSDDDDTDDTDDTDLFFVIATEIVHDYIYYFKYYDKLNN